MSKHILVVDDDALLRRSLAFNLEKNGYRVSTAATAEDALQLARRDPPDLILLDIGLPGMDGVDALKEFRRQADTPVIFVTARRSELDEILGLELGADDYITKPFKFETLLAHIKAVLRRAARSAAPAPEAQAVQVGCLRIDPAAHSVTLNGQSVELTPREFAILHTLALNAGRVVSTDDLLNQVWGAEYAGEPQAVYVYIRWLREKIETDPTEPRRILTVRGVGYKLEPEGF
ncbi:MAG: DNA-binding response regulator [Chloroflexi bacterium]|nr:MAG: DNA-binding response regulator [Chloroflexota bacterium]